MGNKDYYFIRNIQKAIYISKITRHNKTTFEERRLYIVMLDAKLLKAKMVMKDLAPKDFGAQQDWSATTTYRKLNGETPFSIPEVEVAQDLLELTPEDIMAIFFAKGISESE